jgi:hypothetical protein
MARFYNKGRFETLTTVEHDISIDVDVVVDSRILNIISREEIQGMISTIAAKKEIKFKMQCKVVFDEVDYLCSKKEKRLIGRHALRWYEIYAKKEEAEQIQNFGKLRRFPEARDLEAIATKLGLGYKEEAFFSRTKTAVTVSKMRTAGVIKIRRPDQNTVMLDNAAAKVCLLINISALEPVF